MFRQMSQLVVEQSVAVVGCQQVDVALVGFSHAKRRLEMLARQGEALGAVMRRADDHEQRGISALNHLLEAPGERHAAALIINVRHEGGAQLAFGLVWPRQARATRAGEILLQLPAQEVGFGRIAADTGRLADGLGQALAKARAFQKQCFVQPFDQRLEKIDGQKLVPLLPHRFGLDRAKVALAVKEAKPGQLQPGQSLMPGTQAQAVTKDHVLWIAVVLNQSQSRTQPRAIQCGHRLILRPNDAVLRSNYSWLHPVQGQVRQQAGTSLHSRFRWQPNPQSFAQKKVSGTFRRPNPQELLRLESSRHLFWAKLIDGYLADFVAGAAAVIWFRPGEALKALTGDPSAILQTRTSPFQLPEATRLPSGLMASA